MNKPSEHINIVDLYNDMKNFDDYYEFINNKKKLNIYLVIGNQKTWLYIYGDIITVLFTNSQIAGSISYNNSSNAGEININNYAYSRPNNANDTDELISTGRKTVLLLNILAFVFKMEKTVLNDGAKIPNCSIPISFLYFIIGKPSYYEQMGYKSTYYYYQNFKNELINKINQDPNIRQSIEKEIRSFFSKKQSDCKELEKLFNGLKLLDKKFMIVLLLYIFLP